MAFPRTSSASFPLAVDVRHLNNPEYTGIAHYTFEVLRAMRKEKPASTFLLITAGRRFILPKALQAFQAHHIPIPNRLLSLLFFFRLKTLESFLPQQVEAVWLPNINTLYTKKPVFVTVHDTSFLHFPSFFSFFAKLRMRLSRTRALLSSAVKIFTVSQTAKRHIAEAYGIDPVTIIDIPLAVSSHFHSRVEAGDRDILRNYGVEQPYFFSLCTLEPRKNLESVLEAYERLGETRASLVLAGSDGWKTALAGSVHHIGYIREKDRPVLLRNAVALVFPSYYEGFGLPVLESIACGTPVITTIAGALPELAHPLVTYLPPLRVDALVGAMQRALATPTRAKKIPSVPLRTWQQVARETLDAQSAFLRA